MRKNMIEFYDKNCFKRGNKEIEKKEEINKLRNDYYLEQIKLVEVIKNYNIDFHEYGWKNKIHEILKIDRQSIPNWMAKYMPDVLKVAFNNKDYTELIEYYKNNKYLLKNSNYIKL